MNSSSNRFIQKPIFILLAVNILIGLFVFRNYGYSWDEPLFYDYGEALGYAYTPREWFSGNFDLEQSFVDCDVRHAPLHHRPVALVGRGEDRLVVPQRVVAVETHHRHRGSCGPHHVTPRRSFHHRRPGQP